jgi:hypothetical protein
MVIAEINRRHDALRDSLTRQLRLAKSGDEAWETGKRIEEEERERGKELREVGKLRWEGIVDWGVDAVDGEGESECDYEG